MTSYSKATDVKARAGTGQFPATPVPPHASTTQGGHGWMLASCSIVIGGAVLLVLSGVAHAGVIVAAVGMAALIVSMIYIVFSSRDH